MRASSGAGRLKGIHDLASLISEVGVLILAATSLAEKEFVARQAAAKGLLAEDLERLRLTLVPDHQGTQPAQL